MRKAALQNSLKWLWILGVVVWGSGVSFLLWQLPHAESFKQASFYSTRLMYVSCLGVFWGITPAISRAVLKRSRTSQV
jgi:hypothetical protein